MKKYFLTVFILILALNANAETRVAGVVSTTSGLGYETGTGVYAEQRVHLNKLVFVADGTYLWQKKNNADSGYVWRLNGFGRYYPSDRLFISAGYTHGGYKSEFTNGSEWKKDGGAPIIGIGYDRSPFELGLFYQFEDSSPNDVSAFTIYGEYVWKYLFGKILVNFASYEQGGESENGTNIKTFVGIKF